MGISKKELKDMNAYFRALNYISVGQLYLLDNPLLKEGSPYKYQYAHTVCRGLLPYKPHHLRSTLSQTEHRT